MNYLDELEKIRKRIIIKTITPFIVIIAIFSVISISSDENFIFDSNIIIFVFAIIIFIKAYIKKDVQLYKRIFKQNIIYYALQQIFTDVKYYPESGLSRTVIEETKMMNVGDRYHSNDYVSGKYKNINFELADVHIEKRSSDSDGGGSYSTLFKGQWIIFDFNKSFKAKIQVCEKFFKGAKRGDWFGNEVYHRIKMEDVGFNQNFKVYAENELEAFYVLTPNTMQKIQQLNEKINGKLLFCFIDNKLHIGLHNNRDLFEPNVYKKINLETYKNQILNQIKIITEFVDVLDLDNDLFKRRG